MSRRLSSVLVGLSAAAACQLGFQVYALLAHDTVIWTGPLVMGPAGWIYGLASACLGSSLLSRRPDLSCRVAGVGLFYVLLLVLVCSVLSGALSDRFEVFTPISVVVAVPLGLLAAPVFVSEGALALPPLTTGLASVAPLWLALGMVRLGRPAGRRGPSRAPRPATAVLSGTSGFILAASTLALIVPLAFYFWVVAIRPAHPLGGEAGRVRVSTSCVHPQKPIWILVPKRASALVRALETDDEDLRASAAYALGQPGFDRATLERVVVALGNAAGDESDHVREHAVMALGRLRHPRTTALLIEALGDREPSVRRFAADALASRRVPAATLALEAALEDADARVRERARRAIGVLEDERARQLYVDRKRRAAERSVPVFVEGLRDPDEAIRQKALEGLRDAGPAAAPAIAPLIEMLRSEEGTCDQDPGALVVLEAIGPAAVPALIGALGDDDVCVRLAAAQVLERIGPAAQAAIPTLERVSLEDAHVLVRAMASRALDKVQSARQGSSPSLPREAN